MSIDITIEEMEALPAESYELFDIRGEIERAHGILPNSTASSADVLMENPPEDKEKKIIICCSRGQISRDIAEELQEQGYEAYSLKGGYVGWLMADMKKKEADDVCEHVELSIRKKFKKKIWSKFTKAVREYELVKEGDRIAVCISGGKDSMLMAKLFQELKRHNKFNFEVKFLVMDPGYSPENRKVIEENARKMKIPIQIFESNIFESVFEIEKSPCYICARMRRGYLYNFAQQMGCNKIALGHHYDDVIETILMGMLYSAQVQKYLHSDIDTLERTEIIRDMRLDVFDVLVGINLLREGLDIPEITLVAILDADKEGFLRSETSLIQTIGRAARNAEGHVIMYADNMTDSMRMAIDETMRRREIQMKYNEEHGITPQTIKKSVRDLISISKKVAVEEMKLEKDPESMSVAELEKLIKKLEKQMKKAAAELNFEAAAELRDKLIELKKHLNEME